MRIIVGWVGVMQKFKNRRKIGRKFVKTKTFHGKSAGEINQQIRNYVKQFIAHGFKLMDQEILWMKDLEE